MTRVAPLAPPWSEADAADINSWGHPDRTYEPLLLVRCLQRHPAWLASCASWARRSTSRHGCRRACAPSRSCGSARWCGCAYEWGGQAAFWGPIAGVSDDECDALVTGAPTCRWSASERVLIGAVDELETHRVVVRGDVACVGRHLDDEQRMELLIAVGWYRTICTLCNGLDLPVEGWMRRWPRRVSRLTGGRGAGAGCCLASIGSSSRRG